jgi:hypothetical protein
MASRHGKWVIAGTVMIGNIMAVLDSSIVNVALPDMGGNLGATVEEITWVVTAHRRPHQRMRARRSMERDGQMFGTN